MSVVASVPSTTATSVWSSRSVTRIAAWPLITCALVTMSPLLSKIQPVPSDSSLPSCDLHLDGDHAAQVRTAEIGERRSATGVGALAAGGRTTGDLAWIDRFQVRGDQQRHQTGGEEREDGGPGAEHGLRPERPLRPWVHEEALCPSSSSKESRSSVVAAARWAAPWSPARGVGRQVVVPARHPDRVAAAGRRHRASSVISTTRLRSRGSRTAVEAIGPWDAMVSASGGYAGGKAHETDDAGHRARCSAPICSARGAWPGRQRRR